MRLSPQRYTELYPSGTFFFLPSSSSYSKIHEYFIKWSALESNLLCVRALVCVSMHVRTVKLTARTGKWSLLVAWRQKRGQEMWRSAVFSVLLLWCWWEPSSILNASEESGHALHRWAAAAAAEGSCLYSCLFFFCFCFFNCVYCCPIKANTTDVKKVFFFCGDCDEAGYMITVGVK